MRWLVGTICLFLLTVAGRAADPVTSPQSHAALAAAHLLRNVPESEWPYTRYLSFHAVPDKQLDTFRKVLNWWLNQLSFEPAIASMHEVPDSGGRLFTVDLRDYRWNAAAWQAVAERDVIFQEPWVQAKEAAFLRKAIGAEVSAASLKAQRYPVIAIVWAPQLFRDTVESDRTSSYYDLLFAEQRFVTGKPVEGAPGEWWTREVHYKEGEWPGGKVDFADDSGRAPIEMAKGKAFWYEQKFKVKKEGKNAVKFVDFPKDEDDWNKAFGIDLTKRFTGESKINLDYGAVVEGGRDNPKAGSIVALNNRLLVFTPTILGLATKTFDVKETTGERDFAQQLIFKGGKFRRGDDVNAVADAGELLASLPNGGQAGFLINGVGKRIEVADSRFANDTSDKRLNIGVRTPGSCVVCHAGSNGINPPRNLVKEMLEGGVDVRFSDRDQFNRFKAFFQGWDEKTEPYTKAYGGLVDRTTRDPLKPKEKGWTGAKLSGEFAVFRDWYDTGVTPQQAALELGVTIEELKRIGEGSPKARLAQLARGQTVPRRTFEVDVYREAALLLSAKGK